MQNIEQAEDVVPVVVGRCLLMGIVLIVFGCGIGRKMAVGIIILNRSSGMKVELNDRHKFKESDYGQRMKCTKCDAFYDTEMAKEYGVPDLGKCKTEIEWRTERGR